jgi:hypothetical protein
MARPEACPKADRATEADRRAQRFGKSAGELTDTEFGVALAVQGLLAGWNVNWLTHRLQCPLTVESVDGPVEVPPASREFMAFMQELEKISRGGDPGRLKLMLDVMEQAGSGRVEDPKRMLLLALFDANDRNPKLPQTLTGIKRWMNSKHKGCCAGLGDLRDVMRSLGMTATPDRSKRGKPLVDQAGKDLKGKALVTASLRARQPDLFQPRRKPRKTA